MKLLLLSLGLGALRAYLPPNASIGFIPTAGETYEDPYFVNDDRDRLKRLGYKVVEVDVSNGDKTELIATIAGVDALFVAGGNTFYLMQQIRTKGLVDDLKRIIGTGKLYIGASAGAAIVGPTLEPIQSLDDASVAPRLTTMEGLKLVDFVVLPHYGKPKYLPRYQEIIASYSNRFKLIPLADDKALIVTGQDKYQEIDSPLILHEV